MKIKQLILDNITFVPLTIAEAVIVNKNLRLDKVLDKKLETITSESNDLTISSIEKGVNITHTNNIKSNNILSLFQVKFDEFGHITEYRNTSDLELKEYLPINDNILDSINDSSNTILTTKQIIDYFSKSSIDGMRFIGTISINEDGSYTIHTEDGIYYKIPTDNAKGDTYRISATGIYAGHLCSAGDFLICLKNGAEWSKDYWSVVEGNITGAIESVINGKTVSLYSSTLDSFTIYAPNRRGNTNQVLTGGRDIPEWTSLENINVGSADKLNNSLLTSNGISFIGLNNYYNGESEKTLLLLPATNDTIGGIIVDDSTLDIENGVIKLNKRKIELLLQYTPEESNTWRPILINNVPIENTINITSSGGIIPMYSNNDLITNLNFLLEWERYENIV